MIWRGGGEGYGIEEELGPIMQEASGVNRLSTARAVIDLKLAQIGICSSSTCRF